MRKLMKYALFLLFLLAGAFFAYFFLTPDPDRSLYSFVPRDAVYIVESENARDNWLDFSNSDIWKHLKKIEAMKELGTEADELDSLMQENIELLNLFGEKKLLISAHMLSSHPDGYDFLFLIDMEKAAKVTFLKDVVFNLLDDLSKEYDSYEEDGVYFVVIKDPEDDLYISFKENVLLLSYTKELIFKSLKEEKKPFFAVKEDFIKIQDRVPDDGPYRIYLNFYRMQPFLQLYLDEDENHGTSWTDQLAFSGLDLQVESDHAALEGYTASRDSAGSVFNALLKVKNSEILSTQVMPDSVSFFLRLGFKDFHEYLEKLESVMQTDSAYWAEYESSRRKVEKFLKIDFEEHFFSWIGEEVSLAMMPVEDEQAYLAVFHTKNRYDAARGLEFIETQIRKKTPVKFKAENYKGYDIRYLHMKGFFRLFFGKLFNRFEKPHYIIMNEFVVFSNNMKALRKFIDANDKGYVLAENENFDRHRGRFSDESVLYGFINTPLLFPWMLKELEDEDRKALAAEQDHYTRFNRLGFQLKQDGSRFYTEIYTEF